MRLTQTSEFKITKPDTVNLIRSLTVKASVKKKELINRQLAKPKLFADTVYINFK